MSSLDLPEIRAQLAAKKRERRKGGPGAFRTLRYLLSDPSQPLLGRPEPPPMSPMRRPASPELELIDAPAESQLEPEVRRSAFGRRTGAESEADDPPLLLSEPAPEEPPFLLEAQADPLPDFESPPAAAPSPQPRPPAPAVPSPIARMILEQLEQRLLKEQIELIRKLSRR